MLIHDLGLNHRACDRCHGQKLRCEREAITSDCVRCQKAHARCVTSPVRSRPRRSVAASSSSVATRGSRGLHPHLTASKSDSTRLSQSSSTSSNAWPAVSGRVDNPDAHEHLFDWAADPLGNFPDFEIDLDSTLTSRGLNSVGINLGAGAGASPLPASGHPQDRAPRLPRSFEEDLDFHPNQPVSRSHPRSSIAFAAGHEVPSRSQEDLPPSASYQPSTSISLAAQGLMEDFGIPSTASGGIVFGTDFSAPQRASASHYSVAGSHFESGDEMAASFADVCEGNGDLSSGSKPVLEKPIHGLGAWMLSITQLNVELRQHMHSIPPTGWWRDSRAPTEAEGQGSEAVLRYKSFGLDQTLRLSQRYIETLNHVLCKYRTSGSDAQGPSSETHVSLDESSQLLILSGYLCLMETYEKLLICIKTCIQIKLKNNGASAPKGASHIKLPSLMIGSFELPSTSSANAIMLMHVIDIILSRMARLVDSTVQIPRDGLDSDTSRSATAWASEYSETEPPGLNIINQASLKAIKIKEDTNKALVTRVRQMAVQSSLL